MALQHRLPRDHCYDCHSLYRVEDVEQGQWLQGLAPSWHHGGDACGGHAEMGVSVVDGDYAASEEDYTHQDNSCL